MEERRRQEMLVWKVAAMVLVVISALLSLRPVITLFHRYFEDTRKRNYLVVCLVVVLILLSAAFILPKIEDLSHISWLTQYSRWKLALESLVFLAVLAIFVVRVHGRARFRNYFLKGPYLYLMYLPFFVLEVCHYTGIMYTMSVTYISLIAIFSLSEWLSGKVARWLRNESAPLILAVFCLCIANAIQLFVLK
jgi:uncharacterized membrane protein YhaH (DUF805 family)